MRILKKIGIILGILALIIGAVFIIFHDDTDMAEVEKKQIESSSEVTPVMIDNLESSFDENDTLQNDSL
jgi:hypothetical protein